jgi:hypothetical protein
MSVRFGTLSRTALLRAKQARCAVMTHFALSRFLAARSVLLETAGADLITGSRNAVS